MHSPILPPFIGTCSLTKPNPNLILQTTKANAIVRSLSATYDAKRRTFTCGPPCYEPRIEYFTIRLWHDGDVIGATYSGGECEILDWCHAQNFNLKLLDSVLFRVGCTGNVRYLWKPKSNDWWNFHSLDTESDLGDVAFKGLTESIVDVYVEHLSDNPWDTIDAEVGRDIGWMFRNEDIQEIATAIDGNPQIYEARSWLNNERFRSTQTQALETNANLAANIENECESEDSEDVDFPVSLPIPGVFYDPDYDFESGDEDYNGIVSVKLQRDLHGIRTTREPKHSLSEDQTSLHIADCDCVSDEDEFRKLLAYSAELKNIMPGTTVELWRVAPATFKGFYICLQLLKESWKRFLRPIFALGVAPLGGSFQMSMLTAVGIDPNNCFFPIAWAAVAAPNYDTWSWFLRLLQNDLDIHPPRIVTVLAGNDEVLVQLVSDLFPCSEKRICVKHLYESYRMAHPGKEIRDLFWKAATASYKRRFEEVMQSIQALDTSSSEWFLSNKFSKSSWSRSCFEEEAVCDVLINFMCETFHYYIKDITSKGIITMLEMTKNRLMQHIYTKREVSKKWKHVICPKIVRRLENHAMFADIYTCQYSGGPEVRVVERDHYHICNMDLRTCTYRRWDLSGIPCDHAVACIVHLRDSYKNYTDHFYWVETYKNAYSFFIPSTKAETSWEIPPAYFSEVVPPSRRTVTDELP